MNSWWRDAVFYHIYPLGFCGAEPRNDFQSAPVPRLELVSDHIPHMKELGCNALYLGPLFESSAHGYDTADYFKVDRRLGAEDTLRHLVDDCHRAGIRVVLDGVFNHVGREYWAFRDLREDGAASAYTDWFRDIDFGSDSPSQDGFAYQGWEGDHSLVSLNHDNPAVRQHLIQAALWMVETFGIDGLRLDVAYMLDKEFLRELAAACRSREADFWLLGEIIHGDYRSIAGPGLLDSATNYECYKGLYSSHNDDNYFEIAWSLNRQFGPDGMYTHLTLYSFLDNHDVDRIASVLSRREHLPLLYVLLFTVPGIPSVYYGSELGWEGLKSNGDSALRPAWRDPPEINRDLRRLVSDLSELRRNHVALRTGSYRQLHVDHQQFCFERSSTDETLVIAVNSSDRPACVELRYPRALIDTGNAGVRLEAGAAVDLPPFSWGVYVTERDE